MDVNVLIEDQLSFDELLDHWGDWTWNKWPLAITLVDSTYIIPELINRPIEHLRRFILGYYVCEGVRQFLVKNKIFDTLNYNEEGDFFLRRGQPVKALPDLFNKENTYEFKVCKFLVKGKRLHESYKLHGTNYVICYEYNYDLLHLLDEKGYKRSTLHDDDGNPIHLKYGMPLIDKLIDEIDEDIERQIRSIIDF